MNQSAPVSRAPITNAAKAMPTTVSVSSPYSTAAQGNTNIGTFISRGRYHFAKIHTYSSMEELFKISLLTKHHFEKQTGRFASRKLKWCFQNGFSQTNCSTSQSKTPAQHTQIWKVLPKLSIFTWLLITCFQLRIHLSFKLVFKRLRCLANVLFI